MERGRKLIFSNKYNAEKNKTADQRQKITNLNNDLSMQNANN